MLIIASLKYEDGGVCLDSDNKKSTTRWHCSSLHFFFAAFHSVLEIELCTKSYFSQNSGKKAPTKKLCPDENSER